MMRTDAIGGEIFRSDYFATRGKENPDAGARPLRRTRPTPQRPVGEPAISPGEPPAELSPERIAAIRQTVLEGAYDSVDIMDRVARRILDRGDV